MDDGADEVTYESLVNQWKKEHRATTLTRVDSAFYSQVDGRLRQLQEEYGREHGIAPNTAKVMILQDELRNLTRMRDDLYDLREKKIATAALISARGGNPDRGNMTKGERDLYEDLVRVLKEGRRSLLKRGERAMTIQPPDAAPAPPGIGGPPTPPDPLTHAPPKAASAATHADVVLDEPAKEKSLPGLEKPTTPPPEKKDPVRAVVTDAEEKAPAEAAAAEPAARPGAPAPRSGRVLVHVLKDVDAFTASDLRTYRLTPDDVVALPPDAARLLSARGFADPVQPLA